VRTCQAGIESSDLSCLLLLVLSQVGILVPSPTLPAVTGVCEILRFNLAEVVGLAGGIGEGRLTSEFRHSTHTQLCRLCGIAQCLAIRTLPSQNCGLVVFPVGFLPMEATVLSHEEEPHRGQNHDGGDGGEKDKEPIIVES